jgi:hypothetical protein
VKLTDTNRSRTYPNLFFDDDCRYLVLKERCSFKFTRKYHCICIKVHGILHLVFLKNMSGNDGEEATPVPIPNTEVKLFSVDGSWGLSPCESRTLPGVFYAGVAQLVEQLTCNQ